jgi:DNA-binding transcriptional MerR regulator
MTEFLTTGDAARILGKASATVLYYEKIGRLRPIRTLGGVRLFYRDEVERLAGAKGQVSEGGKTDGRY